MGIESHRYTMACRNPDLMTTRQAGEWLGISESRVRKHFMYKEQHHAYKMKGHGGLANFYSRKDILEALRKMLEGGESKRLLTDVDPGILEQARRFERVDTLELICDDCGQPRPLVRLPVVIESGNMATIRTGAFVNVCL